MFLPPSISPRP
jgi:hypothetical protein